MRMMLDAGFSILDARYLILDARWSYLLATPQASPKASVKRIPQNLEIRIPVFGGTSCGGMTNERFLIYNLQLLICGLQLCG